MLPRQNKKIGKELKKNKLNNEIEKLNQKIKLKNESSNRKGKYNSK